MAVFTNQEYGYQMLLGHRPHEVYITVGTGSMATKSVQADISIAI